MISKASQIDDFNRQSWYVPVNFYRLDLYIESSGRPIFWVRAVSSAIILKNSIASKVHLFMLVVIHKIRG